MSEKILPIKQPPIITYKHHAYPLSVIFSHEEAIPWFYSNYIQLFSEIVNEEEFFLNFLSFGTRFVREYVLQDDLIYNVIKPDFAQFIADCIESDYYVVTFLDEFYIPSRLAYKNANVKSDTFIYGYNSDDKYFHLSGDLANSSYGSSKISYDELRTAFAKTERPIILILNKYIENKDYQFDLRNVKELVHEYIFSLNTCERIGAKEYGNRTFGLKTYDNFIQYLNILIAKKNKVILQPFQILYEHKKCMRMRIEYMQMYGFMQNLDYLHSAYVGLEKQALILENLALKYKLNAGTHVEILSNMIASLQNMQKEEQRALELYFD